MRQPRKPAGPHRDIPAAPIPAMIEATAIYPLATFCRINRWGPRALALAKRQGLRIVRFSRWGYVRGVDAMAFFERLAAGEGQQ